VASPVHESPRDKKGQDLKAEEFANHQFPLGKKRKTNKSPSRGNLPPLEERVYNPLAPGKKKGGSHVKFLKTPAGMGGQVLLEQLLKKSKEDPSAKNNERLEGEGKKFLCQIKSGFRTRQENDKGCY